MSNQLICENLLELNLELFKQNIVEPLINSLPIDTEL